MNAVLDLGERIREPFVFAAMAGQTLMEIHQPFLRPNRRRVRCTGAPS
jgi:hypothetical protein